MRQLDSTSTNFSSIWQEVCDRASSEDTSTEQSVAKILRDVRSSGDKAVAKYTQKFDARAPNEASSYEIPPSQWVTCYERCSPEVKQALALSVARIKAFHEPQAVTGYQMAADGSAGSALRLRVSPLQRVGIYVPGGTARYPSSVLMTAIPAKLAGVAEIIMVTPGASDETLAAAHLAGVDRVFEIGGAQAIAALAFGTDSIPRVDKIVGPGNQWVAAAKRQVFGHVDIDSIAGPSEVLIIADESADPTLLAADLLAQAEHDQQARCLLLSDNLPLLQQVDNELDSQLATLPRNEIASASLTTHGVSVHVPSIESAIHLANQYAPEHLELACRSAGALVDSVQNAGAIFVGHHTPEAAGDYSAGPNHVLPTGGAARYASPLGVYDFQKYTSILELQRNDLASLQAPIIALCKVEGLEGHARSVALRVTGANNDE